MPNIKKQVRDLFDRALMETGKFTQSVVEELKAFGEDSKSVKSNKDNLFDDDAIDNMTEEEYEEYVDSCTGDIDSSLFHYDFSQGLEGVGLDQPHDEFPIKLMRCDEIIDEYMRIVEGKSHRTLDDIYEIMLLSLEYDYLTKDEYFYLRNDYLLKPISSIDDEN